MSLLKWEGIVVMGVLLQEWQGHYMFNEFYMVEAI